MRSTPAPKEAELLSEVDERGLSHLMTRNPLIIDLISYLYPKRELEYKDLWQMLRERPPGADENLVLFRADQKMADKFRAQLSALLNKMRQDNAIPRPEKLRCFFKVDPDIDQVALKEHLDKRIGVGKVTDEQMRYVAQAWDDPEDH